MYSIYIIKSMQKKQYYIGCTDNIIRRLSEHNKGLSQYTKGKGPWELVYKEEFINLKEARARERQIKSWKKRAAIEKLINAAFV